MSSETLNIEARIKTLNTVLTETHDRQTVDEALRATNGDIPAALASLKGKLPGAALQKVALAHALAVWADDHVLVVKALSREADITNLRDAALRFNVEQLTALVDPNIVPAYTVGATAAEKQKNFAIDLHNKLYTALKHPDAFKGIADEHHAGAVEQLKTLQRVQATSPMPEAIPVLFKANLTSAFRVAELPESPFLNATVGPWRESRQAGRMVATMRVTPAHNFA